MQATSVLPAAELEARKYVKRLREFYQLCVVAVLVIALTATVNLLTSPDRLWFPWVIVGFALALAFSAWDTFGSRRWLGSAWQERKVREYLQRHQG